MYSRPCVELLYAYQYRSGHSRGFHRSMFFPLEPLLPSARPQRPVSHGPGTGSDRLIAFNSSWEAMRASQEARMCGIGFCLLEDRSVFWKTGVFQKPDRSSGRPKMCRSILMPLVPPVGCGIQVTYWPTNFGRFVLPGRILRFRLPEDRSVFQKTKLPEDRLGLLEDRPVFWKTKFVFQKTESVLSSSRVTALGS